MGKVQVNEEKDVETRNEDAPKWEKKRNYSQLKHNIL